MKSGITLKVKAFDTEGNITAEECKENDLFLWNWGVFIAQFFKMQFQYSDPTVYQFTDINGTVRNTSATGMCGYNSGQWNDTSRVQIGSGTNAPSITDYNLQQFIAEVIPNLPDVVVSGNTLKVVFAATFPFSSETTVAETGIKMGDCLVDGYPFLITRDTFTPVTVSAGGSLSLQYELWFNATPT